MWERGEGSERRRAAWRAIKVQHVTDKEKLRKRGKKEREKKLKKMVQNERKFKTTHCGKRMFIVAFPKCKCNNNTKCNNKEH